MDDFDGLEQGAGVSLQDAVADGVLNVRLLEEIGEELLDRLGVYAASFRCRSSVNAVIWFQLGAVRSTNPIHW